ncbi:MAG: hypothetical protein WCF44_20690 [Candidatus Methylophosphatis roskildensis]
MIALDLVVIQVLADVVGLVALSDRPRRSIEAEKLFLRRQPALDEERGVKPRRIDAATRISLALLSRLFDWRSALIVARLETLIRWHRAGWRLARIKVTAHPTVAWTLQGAGQAIGFEQDYRYLFHGRDSIFAKDLDEFLVLPRSSQVNLHPLIRRPLFRGVLRRRQCLGGMRSQDCRKAA